MIVTLLIIQTIIVLYAREAASEQFEAGRTWAESEHQGPPPRIRTMINSLHYS